MIFAGGVVIYMNAPVRQLELRGTKGFDVRTLKVMRYAMNCSLFENRTDQILDDFKINVCKCL